MRSCLIPTITIASNLAGAKLAIEVDWPIKFLVEGQLGRTVAEQGPRRFEGRLRERVGHGVVEIDHGPRMRRLADPHAAVRRQRPMYGMHQRQKATPSKNPNIPHPRKLLPLGLAAFLERRCRC